MKDKKALSDQQMEKPKIIGVLDWLIESWRLNKKHRVILFITLTVLSFMVVLLVPVVQELIVKKLITTEDNPKTVIPTKKVYEDSDGQLTVIQNNDLTGIDLLSYYIPDVEARSKLLNIVKIQSEANDIPMGLILSVIEIESGFNSFSISSDGLQGLMQVPVFWKRELGRLEDNFFDIETNIRYGTIMLKRSLGQSKGGDVREGLIIFKNKYLESSYVANWQFADLVMVAWQNRWEVFD